jgi:oligosaccharide repeat unit polymerase
MTVGWRVLLVGYLVLYDWLFPAISANYSDDASGYLIARVLVHLAYVLLLCFPLIFYRREYGFLHPLILPTLFTILKQVGESPLSLVQPFANSAFSFNVSTTSPAVSLAALSHGQLAFTRLELDAGKSLALVCLYAGYFLFRHIRVPRATLHEPRRVGPVCFAATMACVGVSFAFIEVFGGGISSLLVAERNGRNQLFNGLGQFLQIAEFSLLPALVWFAYRRRPALNPWWLVAFVSACLASLLTTGSRSSVILPLAILMFLWWRKAGRVVIAPGIALALVALVLVGAFGAIRDSYGSQSLDTSVLSVNAVGGNIANANAEFQSRNSQESDLAAFAGAAHSRLDGRSYVGAIAFLIPRAIWPRKPRSGDTYNMAVNFEGRSIGNYLNGKTWGVPMGPVAEAYWNFGIPGIVIVFLVLALIFRWLSELVWRNPESLAMLVVAVWVGLNLSGTSLSFISNARDLVLLGLLYYALGIWRPTFFLSPTRRRGDRLRLARRVATA